MQRVSVALGFVAVVVGSGGGCTADSGDEAILVLKNVHAGEGCLATNAASETGIAHGALDLVFHSGYVFVAQLKSRITALAGQEDQRTIFTSGANVDIKFPGSTFFSDTELTELQNANLTHFKQPFTVPIAPGGISDVPFDLIPDSLAERIAVKAGTASNFRLEALATFTVVGDMSGGDVSSQPFTFAVTLGNSIVVFNRGACSALPTSFVARPGYACNLSQDDALDCCENGTMFTCPAVKPTSAR
jgi:hypothetical protein